MRKIAFAAAAFVALVFLLGVASAEPVRIETKSGSLNMRSKANSNAVVVVRIPNGSVAELIERGETWSRVEYKGKKGYVKSQFIKPISEDEIKKEKEEEAELLNLGYAWIKTDGGSVNMRRKADANSAVVGHVPNGRMVQVEKATRSWCRIAYKGESGYVKTEYLQLPVDMLGDVIYPDHAYIYVRSSASKAANSVAVIRDTQPMTILDMTEEWITVSYSDPSGQSGQGYVAASDVSEFRKTPGNGMASKLSISIALSAQSIHLGDELDVEVSCQGDVTYAYRVYKDGKLVFDGKPVARNRGTYRPREAGNYRIEVVVSEPSGRYIGQEAFFMVESQLSQSAYVSGTSGVYSQKDGWWLDKKYSRSNLDASGCAIFTLSHALASLGFSGDAIAPHTLAKTYPMYLAESGTVTANLLAAAGRDFGFRTEKDKISDLNEIARLFEAGAVFSFSVANGHIAFAAGLSDDGTKVKVLDSAPYVTFERLVDASMYTLDDSGAYHAVQRFEDIPGAKYYFETDSFGGLAYYMDLSYLARRGVRPLIKK